MNFLMSIILILLQSSTTSALHPNDPEWLLSQRNVCFGPQTDAEFTIISPGLLTGLKLEHLHGNPSQNGTPVEIRDCIETNISVDFQLTDSGSGSVTSLEGRSTAWECGELKSLSYILELSNPIFFNAGIQILKVWTLEPNKKEPFFTQDICFDVYGRIAPLRPLEVELKSTACETCGDKRLATSQCLKSTIKVNNIELSQQENGLNLILVSQNRTVSESATFRSDQQNEFINYFTFIPPGSVFAIVLQNMCSFNSSSPWVKHLIQNENITFLNAIDNAVGLNHRNGIVVGCKIGGCIDVQPKLPYSYVGEGADPVEPVSSSTFTIKLMVNPHKVVSPRSRDSVDLGNASTSIIIFMVVTILSIGVVGLFLVVRRRSERNLPPKTDDHNMLQRPSTTVDSTKTEEYLGYSAFSDVNKSAEHIYAYVDPQMLKGIMGEESKPALPMTSRSSNQYQRRKESVAEVVAVEGSSETYMAPSSIPKYDAETLGTPTMRPSPHSDSNLPTVYEAMGGYPEGSVANVTYEEISTAHRKVPTREISAESSLCDVLNSSRTDSEFDTSTGTEPCSPLRELPGPPITEEMYVNVGPFRTYSNGSQYISLATGETVDISEPLYQRISFEEFSI